MKARIKETDMSVPYRENGYWYSFRYEEGKEYRRSPAPQRMEPARTDADLLDENKLAEGHGYFDLGDYEISPNNRIVRLQRGYREPTAVRGALSRPVDRRGPARCDHQHRAEAVPGRMIGPSSIRGRTTRCAATRSSATSSARAKARMWRCTTRRMRRSAAMCIAAVRTAT